MADPQMHLWYFRDTLKEVWNKQVLKGSIFIQRVLFILRRLWQFMWKLFLKCKHSWNYLRVTFAPSPNYCILIHTSWCHICINKWWRKRCPHNSVISTPYFYHDTLVNQPLIMIGRYRPKIVRLAIG